MGPLRMYLESHFDLAAELRRFEALLEMADVLVRHHNPAELFPDLAERLRQVVAFDFIAVALHSPSDNTMRLNLSVGVELGSVPHQLPVTDTPSGWVWEHQQPLLVPDINAEERFRAGMNVLSQEGIHSYCAMPLTTAQKRWGAISLGTKQPTVWQELDMRLLRRVADLVVLAIENAANKGELEHERERFKMLLEVNTTLASSLDFRQLLAAISKFIRSIVKQDHASVALYEEPTHTLRLHTLDVATGHGRVAHGVTVPMQGTLPGRVLLERRTTIFNEAKIAAHHSLVLPILPDEGFRTVCCIPLVAPKGVVGTLNLASREENAFSSDDLALLEQIASHIAIALDNAHAYEQIAHLKDKLTEEKLYLEDEIRSELNFEEIIGESSALRRVLAQAKTVAPSGATALLLGETGTGKELVARAIHRMSSRRNHSFIKLNCAAIPTGLLESELFGHEKGAFTGAISQKVGRLELANGGTLFLDEVGDIPLELQPKLLRVLQDQEFERLGSTRTLRVDVRLVAATNRDLERAMEEKQFRSDLFYRLNVFPIRIPPLRERRDDVPLLVRYFVQMYSRRMNKPIETISTATMNALLNWEWPGNVRELENFIERSVILTEGSVLNVPLAELRQRTGILGSVNGTLESMEREHILRVLQETGGVIGGKSGAAARLGLKRTTLQSRIQRLGISRQDYQN